MDLMIAGTGYVGLVSGTCFADLGHNVICTDIDGKKIGQLQNGIIPIYEPGLEELVHRNSKLGRLSFTTDISSAVKASEIIFICVGTPSQTDGSADLTYVGNVARQVAEVMDSYKIIVEKSTVPVRTGQWVKKIVEETKRNGLPFDVVSNPEFLREGCAVSDFRNPDRIVIGCESEFAREKMERLYKSLNAKMVFTDIESAELIKHASNSFLAIKISFINAVSRVCELAGADVEMVAEGMGHDRRIGNLFLKPGIGYGGSCFPKDVRAFNYIARELGYDFSLLRDTDTINHEQRIYFIKKIKNRLGVVQDSQVGVLGLAFKPDTDDMRESPAIDIINALHSNGAHIKAYDPEAMAKARSILPEIAYCSSAYHAAEGSDCLVVVTDWNEFKELDLQRVKRLMRNPLVVDGRNLYEPCEMKRLGFTYVSIGRK